MRDELEDGAPGPVGDRVAYVARAAAKADRMEEWADRLAATAERAYAAAEAAQQRAEELQHQTRARLRPAAQAGPAESTPD